MKAVFEPIRIGPVEVRNRIVSTSHQTTLVVDGMPTDDLIAYHAARAHGGVGTIVLEATAVHENGRLTSHTIAGYDPAVVPGYERLSAAIHEGGARLFVQLFHCGRERIGSAPIDPSVAPSAVPTTRFHTEPRAVTARELKEIVAAYATAAALAQAGGLDGVEVSMAHSYLVGQFFNPATNHRDDAYGVDRVRFGREVLEAIREAVGSTIAVGVRVAADEVAFDGLDPRACADVTAALVEGGLVDYVSAAMGSSSTYVGSTWIVPPPPEEPLAIAGPIATLRAALPPELPVIATTRVHDLAAADDLIASGRADLVGMPRALIADPELVAKAQAGRSDDVIPCIGCNQGCIGHYHAEIPIGCLVNLRTGRERSFVPPPRSVGRRVLIVGAGPAGITAACEAAEAGDRVTLADAQDGIGGQLRLAGRCPAHAELWSQYAPFATRRLERAGVVVELGRRVTVDDCDDYDAIVIATGALPYRPPLDRLGERPLVQAWDAIADPAAVRGPALIADWGGEWAGVDAAERLAEAGVETTLACAATVPAETLHQYQRNGYLGRLDRLGVRILEHMELIADGSGLRHVFSGRLAPLPAGGTLVLALGRVPDDALYRALEDDARVTRAGDVLGPRCAEEAIIEGARAAGARV